MSKLSIVACLLVAVAVSGDDDLKTKVFHFTIQNDVGESIYNFEYTLDNGEKFNGRAIPLNDKIRNIFVMMGANDSFFWANISEDDLKKVSFNKAVNNVPLDRENELLAHLKDDFVSYYIYKNGRIFGGPFTPDWDRDEVAFQLADSKGKIFNYIIYSNNNGLQHRGITSYTDDPHVQKVTVPDRTCYSYQVTFTDDEFNSTEIIYKPLDETQICFVGAGGVPGDVMEINPNLLKSLAG